MIAILSFRGGFRGVTAVQAARHITLQHAVSI